MATWTKFNSFVEALAEGTHNLGSNTLRIALSNVAPSAANTVLADITQIAATGGYTPAAVTVSSSAQSGGVYSLVAAATVFTAAGAAFASFRYAVLYNDTAAGDPLIAYWDYGTSYALPDGQTFTFNAATILTLA